MSKQMTQRHQHRDIPCCDNATLDAIKRGIAIENDRRIASYTQIWSCHHCSWKWDVTVCPSERGGELEAIHPSTLFWRSPRWSRVVTEEMRDHTSGRVACWRTLSLCLQFAPPLWLQWHWNHAAELSTRRYRTLPRKNVPIRTDVSSEWRQDSYRTTLRMWFWSGPQVWAGIYSRMVQDDSAELTKRDNANIRDVARKMRADVFKGRGGLSFHL